jgi:transcriptional regulator with XRE-family HTH domain
VRDLLNISKILEVHPDLYEQFRGISEVFAQIIFKSRVEKGISQSELAKLAGVENAIIYRAEGGSVNLGEEIYEKIFKALDLPVNEVKKIINEFKNNNKKE